MRSPITLGCTPFCCSFVLYTLVLLKVKQLICGDSVYIFFLPGKHTTEIVLHSLEAFCTIYIHCECRKTAPILNVCLDLCNFTLTTIARSMFDYYLHACVQYVSVNGSIYWLCYFYRSHPLKFICSTVCVLMLIW